MCTEKTVVNYRPNDLFVLVPGAATFPALDLLRQEMPELDLDCIPSVESIDECTRPPQPGDLGHADRVEVVAIATVCGGRHLICRFT